MLKSPTAVALGCTIAVTWAMYANGYSILPTVVVGMIVMALVARFWATLTGSDDRRN